MIKPGYNTYVNFQKTYCTKLINKYKKYLYMKLYKIKLKHKHTTQSANL